MQLNTVTCMKIQELNKNRALLVEQKPSMIVGLIKSRGSILKFIFRSQIYRRNSSDQARPSQAKPYLITTVETDYSRHACMIDILAWLESRNYMLASKSVHSSNPLAARGSKNKNLMRKITLQTPWPHLQHALMLLVHGKKNLFKLNTSKFKNDCSNVSLCLGCSATFSFPFFLVYNFTVHTRINFTNHAQWLGVVILCSHGNLRLRWSVRMVRFRLLSGQASRGSWLTLLISMSI